MIMTEETREEVIDASISAQFPFLHLKFAEVK